MHRHPHPPQPTNRITQALLIHPCTLSFSAPIAFSHGPTFESPSVNLCALPSSTFTPPTFPMGSPISELQGRQPHLVSVPSGDFQ